MSDSDDLLLEEKANEFMKFAKLTESLLKQSDDPEYIKKIMLNFEYEAKKYLHDDTS